MLKGKFATLTSWSYSVYGQYIKCPLSVCFDKVQKIRIKEPDNPAFIKGDRIHKCAELQIRPGKVPALEPELNKPKLKALLAKFRKMKAAVELEWAFDKAYNPVSWFDKTAWLRMKTDVCADTVKPPVVDIVDWKTGKQYDDHREQRSLYALGGLQLVQLGKLAGGSKDVKLSAAHIYVDTGITATEDFAMKDLAPLKREWATRIKSMMEDTTYPAKTGFHCRYCRFAKSKGGPCPEKM